MKNLAILGAGTAGTMVANHVRKSLPRGWRITLIDPAPEHLYQPGLLFIPFGGDDGPSIRKPRRRTLGGGLRWVQEEIAALDTERREVLLANGSKEPYDLLVIATGSEVYPAETPGLLDGGWRRDIFDFYTLAGARALRDALVKFQGGRLVLNVVENPIKCPVAPLEFLFLADYYFSRRGVRERVELVYATPLDSAFTKPVCSKYLSKILEGRGIQISREFNAGEVDPKGRVLQSYDGRQEPYDLLVTIPTHKGAAFLERSGLGNDLNFVPTDPHTLRAKGHQDIFVLGDATDLPSSKAGSVAHFQSEVVAGNLLRSMRGEELEPGFDGHANCFIETGFGKALLIDFNYEIDPLPGTYPVPGLGPFSLLKETRVNHWGKLAFRWLYWNFLLPARPVPISSSMSMAGKKQVSFDDPAWAAKI